VDTYGQNVLEDSGFDFVPFSISRWVILEQQEGVGNENDWWASTDRQSKKNSKNADGVALFDCQFGIEFLDESVEQ
jgi:hypothetical protein